MASKEDSLAWTYAFLAVFAEQIQRGKFGTGVRILADLNDAQRNDVINNSIMLLDRGMGAGLAGAPTRLSDFGGIHVPLAAELGIRGYSSNARGVVATVWQGKAEEYLSALVQRRGLKFTTEVASLSAASMLLTWQEETGNSLEAIASQFPRQ